MTPLAERIVERLEAKPMLRPSNLGFVRVQVGALRVWVSPTIRIVREQDAAQS